MNPQTTKLINQIALLPKIKPLDDATVWKNIIKTIEMYQRGKAKYADVVVHMANWLYCHVKLFHDGSLSEKNLLRVFVAAEGVVALPIDDILKCFIAQSSQKNHTAKVMAVESLGLCGQTTTFDKAINEDNSLLGSLFFHDGLQFTVIGSTPQAVTLRYETRVAVLVPATQRGRWVEMV